MEGGAVIAARFRADAGRCRGRVFCFEFNPSDEIQITGKRLSDLH
jgi:hypothetical protein